jgi:tRNA 2-thiocytidine biosynthesis protein TtcA
MSRSRQVGVHHAPDKQRRNPTTRLEKRLLREMGRAIQDFELINEGDRIMVAVSGGKDSLSLLSLLSTLQQRAPVRFSLVAVNLDQGQPEFPADRLKAHFESLGVEHRMIREDTFSVVKKMAEPGQTYCFLCARFRRGILYRVAIELCFNKIALGHHREDLIETLLLSAFFSGALKSMPPKLLADDGRNVIIRPLAYCSEENLRAFAEERELPVVPCGICSTQDNQQRRKVKELLAQLEKEHPAVKGNLLSALSNVVPSHLLDRSLYCAARRYQSSSGRKETAVRIEDCAAGRKKT